MEDFDHLILDIGTSLDVAIAPDQEVHRADRVSVLDVGQAVTIGRAGWWVIDELVIVGSEGIDGYRVVPWSEWGAAETRTARTATSRVLPAAELWVYLDRAEPPPSEGVERATSDQEPPLWRRARPARDLPTLTGRRLRARTRTGWAWVIALGEPREATGDRDTWVPVADPRDHARAVYGEEPDYKWVFEPPIYNLFTY